MIYAGSAIGAVFAGDLVTLFIFWEGIAVASVFLIWAARTERAYRAGMRYLVMHVGSGVLLLAGVLIHYRQTGSLAFGALGLDSPGTVLIFLAFGIKCAFPLLHNWLQDAYPEATVTGTVLLSSFTTKVAVYALARGFAGTEILVPIGATMTAFPIFYAVIENDLRRVLAYSLNNQLGFMVVGIGLGTELALNGAVAHAFADILFKGLLFMSMGAVLFRVGTAKGSELGGLYKSMPWTTGFCMVGAASISAFPLFSGFVTKSMVIAAAMDQGYFWTWIVLLFASAGVFHHAGIKIPYFAFFAHDSGKALQGGAGAHAGRHGDRGGAVHRHRQSSLLVLFDPAVQGRFPSLQPRSCRRAGAIAVPVGPRLHAADADRDLSARAALDQSGLRLVLSAAGTRARARRRALGRACMAVRHRLQLVRRTPGLQLDRALPWSRRHLGAYLADRRDGALDDDHARRLSDFLLPVIAKPGLQDRRPGGRTDGHILRTTTKCAMFLYPRSKDRPYHFGPFPLESLPRDEGVIASETDRAAIAAPTRLNTRPDDALRRALDHYHEIFSKFIDGTPAKAKAPVPDDLERRSADVKGGAYFMDASCVGICRIPAQGWLAGAAGPKHRLRGGHHGGASAPRGGRQPRA